MGNANINSIDYKELYAQYNWFANSYPPMLQQACDEFFLEGFQFILLGISKNINTLMDKDSYFVTKIRVDQLHDVFFRISEKTVGIILNRVLGAPNSRFNLNKLTDLEAKIITSFNDYVYGVTSQFLIPAPPVLKRTNFDVVHLTFLLKDKDTNDVSKFIISLPSELLNPDVVVSTADKFVPSDFPQSIIDVAMQVGTTKLKLIDVKNIEVDDIVVLDDSSSNHMVLKFKDYEKDVNINPNLGLVIPFEDNGGSENMADVNLWDSIEVDMTAQFNTVKITLGELKNIEEGLVVDLTSIYDNKVTLSVENKPVARGELVIVNDRYGVKVNEVVVVNPDEDGSVDSEGLEETYDEFSNQPEQEVYNEQPVEETENVSDDDEFDYSDFELEDEDI